MPDVIARAAGKLDDPLMLEWALGYYRHLPKNARDSRSRIERTWFHDLFTAQLIERAETGILSRLFRSLPSRHFSNLTALICKHWSDWQAQVANAATPVLAVNAPEDLLGLFEAELNRIDQGIPLDAERFIYVDSLANSGTEERRLTFYNRLCLRVLAMPDSDLGKSLLLYRLLRLAGSLSADTLVLVLDAALRIEARESAREGLLNQLFRGLFGHAEFLDLAIARSKKHSQQRFEALAPFFRQEAPVGTLDEWVDAPPTLAGMLPALETVSGTSKACATIRTLLQSSKTICSSLPASTQSLLVVAACLQAYANDNFDAAGLDLEKTADLLAADLDTARWYRPLFERLCSFPPHDVVTAMKTRLPAVEQTYGAVQLADAMGDLGWEDFVPCLIEAMSDDHADFLCEAAKNALVEIGRPAQESLIAGWAELDRCQRIYGLSVIRDVGGVAAADFTLARFDELMGDGVEHCCELVLASPDQRLLNRLRPELRRRQALIDRTFHVIARLLDLEDEDSTLAKGRALEDLNNTQNIGKALAEGGDFHRDSLSLELRCPSCGSVNVYKVKGVIIARNPQHGVASLVNDEVPCASCSEDVEFEFTAMAMMAVTAELLLINVARESAQPRQLLVKPIDCRLDGQVMPLAAGLKRLRDHIAKTPTDARAWFRMGNLLFPMNRPKATMAALRQAAKLAPQAIDAQLTLARLLASRQENEDAFELLTDGLNRSSNWQFLAPYPNFAQEFADIYNYLRRSLGKNDLPALHPSSLAPSKKTGRNDPCPCGCGKKFKLCCGR